MANSKSPDLGHKKEGMVFTPFLLSFLINNPTPSSNGLKMGYFHFLFHFKVPETLDFSRFYLSKDFIVGISCFLHNIRLHISPTQLIELICLILSYSTTVHRHSYFCGKLCGQYFCLDIVINSSTIYSCSFKSTIHLYPSIAKTHRSFTL